MLQAHFTGQRTGRRGILVITKAIRLLIAGLVLTPSCSLANISFGTIEHTDVTVRYELPLKAAAVDLADETPFIKADLAAQFGWNLPQRPTVVLIQNREMFRQLAGHPLIAAYAVPADNLIVIDFGRLNRRPRRGKSLLKHEMVHLLLHMHIAGNRLPRWLEEGVAQWASDGVVDLLEEPRSAMLTEAILSGTVLPLADLAGSFPTDDHALLLAYAQSRSVVAFIADNYGSEKIGKILGLLKDGSGIEDAVLRSLSVSVHDLEKRWLSDQERPAAFLALLAGYLYEILFLVGALLTVVGFVRFRIKKRRYRDEEDEI